MNSKFVCLIFISFCINNTIQAQTNYKKLRDGIVVYTDSNYTGVSQAVKLEVIANNIIRVIVAPGRTLPQFESLVTIPVNKSNLQWNVSSSKETITLKTSQVSATIHSKTGAVSFFDAGGKPLLREKQINGRSITPVIVDGQRSFATKQQYTTTADDAIYGLGQHQDDVYNHKGQQVLMFQNNTEVAIPFLVSKKNYGILWDNYSLTTAGDLRPFHPLSSLKLFSKDGDAGWLTASYSNNKNKPDDVVLTRPESSINMEFINESKMYLPEAFKPQNGIAVWEGSLESSFEGAHKLRFTYGGYLKVWVDNKLVLDRWRRAWNPAPALFDVHFSKGKKLPVKIEWIPEGEESYLSLKWKEPANKEQLNTFGFSSSAGKQIDYYFITGTSMDDVISGYRTLTGKAPILPKWALGFWQSRERYKTQDEVLSTVAEFRKRKIPLDNIVLDWFYWRENDWGSQDFDPARFPNPDSMIKVVHENNAKLMISVWPKFYEGIKNYNDFDAKGWLYKRNIRDRQKDWVGPGYISTFYDAFNEDARKVFWNLIHEKIYTKGIDAWWMDASEPDILSNVSPERRIQQMAGTSIGPAAEYLNAYPLQNAKGIYEGQRSVDSNKRVFLLTRSGFAGSQRYGATIWSGDIGARWHDMKAQISAGVNFSMSGLPYWTMDIGGFVVENRFEKPNEEDLEEWRELNSRWFQFGAFVPLFRAHGQYPFREIYNIAPENHPAYKSMLYYNKLRYRLLPYLYSMAGAAYHSNYTLMRGLVMDFSSDTIVTDIGDQYMFGSSLLINPVYNFKERSRNLYLPKGQGWFDLYSGKWYGGGKHITADAPYEIMPLFVKEGSIIPFGPELQYTSQKPADTITLNIYSGKDASFNLYEDSGTTYDYEKGFFSNIAINFNEQEKSLTIADRIGSFDGMIQKRVFILNFISKDKPLPLDFNLTSGKLISYEGKRVKVSLQ